MEGIPPTACGAVTTWCHKMDADILVTSQPTWVYNCIAFAMGSQDMWVASAHPNGWYAWWPDDVKVPRNSHPMSLIAAFQYMGFELCEDNLPEEGFDKVVLYQIVNPNTNQLEWTHAAKVIGEHRLHSKIGAWYDVQHRDGDVFTQCPYGEEYAYMRRPIVDRYKTQEKLPTQCEVNIGGDDWLIRFNGQKIVEMRKI